MNVYWKDLESNGLWSGIEVHAQGNMGRPHLHLESFNNARIKLVSGDDPVFWATISKDYYGVWFLKAYHCRDNKSLQLVSHINSQDIEIRKGLSREQWLRSWMTYFIKELSDEGRRLLHDGLWFLKAYQGRVNKDKWEYSAFTNTRHVSSGAFYNVKDCLTDQATRWVDWEINGSGDLLSLRRVYDDSSRVKWWRKKVKEGSLPPIVCWYINCLDAYIIIDGHDRLRASIIEGVPPDILCLYSAQEYKVSIDKATTDRVIDSLFNRSPQKSKKQISVDQMNAVLINAFDDSPYVSYRTYSWASHAREDLWLNEVKAFLDEVDEMEFYESIRDRL
jgi:hypothetical protein